MHPLRYRIAEVSGKISAAALLPVGALTAFLCCRSYEVDGIAFILIDPWTVIGIIAALLLTLAALFWWDECGYGWPDLLKLCVAISPLGILLWRLDPAGIAPVSF